MRTSTGTWSLRTGYAAAIGAALLFTGCMSPMALRQGRAPDLRNRSVALFTLRTSNAYAPGFQPRVLWIEVEGGDRTRRFKTGRAHHSDSDGYQYLVSVDLKPGRYTLMDIMGESVRFPLVQAQFQFPVHGVFEIPPGAVTYVGRVEMVNRKRREGEPASGRMVPPIDQTAAGYADGTFDITISDRSEMDLALFTQAYPHLEQIPISTALMRRYLSYTEEP